MNTFKIPSELSWYTSPTTNARQRGQFLSQPIDAFYHSDYQGGDETQRNTIGTVENVICTLKNRFQNKSKEVLLQAENDLIGILKVDLPLILQKTRKDNLTVCVIPRAKAEGYYSENQKLFRKVISLVVDKLSQFDNGISYIIRHTNTRTTHLDRSGHGGEGDLPYPGITKNTCTISSEVKGKDILLIDDLYTKTVNIDEDAIQALLDKGANSVVFYAIGKTLQRNTL